MKNELGSHLKMGVMVAWVVIWNVLCGIGIWINGGLGSIQSPVGLGLAALALISTALFALLILYSPRVRAFAMRPDGDLNAIRNELRFTAFLTTLLGLAALYSLFEAIQDA